MKSFFQQNETLLLFLLKLGVLCGFFFFWFEPNVWKYEILAQYWGYIVHYTALALTNTTVLLLGVFGYGAEVVGIREIDLYDSARGTYIANVCLGLDMMFTLSALIISYPGKWLDRMWFLPIGLSGIFFINVIRVFGLSLIVIFWGGEKFDINHRFFNIMASAFIFLMFVAWVRRSQNRKPAG